MNEQTVPAIALVVPTQILDIIVNALAQRPYIEVEQTISLIRQQANDKAMQEKIAAALEPKLPVPETTEGE